MQLTAMMLFVLLVNHPARNRHQFLAAILGIGHARNASL